VKLRSVSSTEVEFCSSLFIPTANGTVLVPKPGKLLAKTFWCKNLHYNGKQIQQQFASILKGMSNTMSGIPGFCGLYNNQLYREWFPLVEAHYEQYNEYANTLVVYNEDTVVYLLERYGLTLSQLDDLFLELSSGFPVRLSSAASQAMIEKDWGPPNDGEHLRQQFYTDEQGYTPLFMEWTCFALEEACRYYNPWLGVVIGGIESLAYRTWINVLVHTLLTCLLLLDRRLFVLITCLHASWNLVAGHLGSGKLNLLVMTKKKSRGNIVNTVVIRQPRVARKRNNKRKGRNFSPFLASKINPFLASTNGIRAPDEFGYPTGTAVVRTSYPITVNASGVAAHAFMPFVSEQDYYAASTSTATALAWATGGTPGQAPQNPALTALASVYRTVSYGVRVTTDLSLTSASGHAWIAAVPLNLAATFPYLDFPTSEAAVAQMPLSEKFSLVEMAERPIIVPGRSFDDGVYRFRSVGSTYEQTSTASSLESSTGWCAIVVVVVGAPASTTALNIEMIQHIEYIQNGSTLYGFIDTLPGEYNSGEMAAASKIEALSPVGFMETTVSTMEDVAVSAGSIMRLTNRAIKVATRLSGLAGSVMQARGYLRGPAASPFAQIEYKQDY